ncbi:hypothetical protein HHK36_004461 [Tetracentron sinense]|uniref:DDT domain-containing protein n=1 Tax=Tetracentron sinense TaxID=13715 RepID=A0A835DQB9_TETSI|nr:hypothetical protein HHK36_004461 [Tetracentron sinense]
MDIGLAGNLRLKDLINTISEKLQERLPAGIELYGRKDKCACLCKILKVLDKDDGKILYEVEWLDKDKKVMGASVVTGNVLIRKKLPFSRDVLKSFIRESTTRSAPWMIHDNLARKHGVSTEPPEELRDKILIQDGCHVSSKRRSKNKGDGENITDARKGENDTNKRKSLETENLAMAKKSKKEGEKTKEEPIKYPIDDLLVRPGAKDPVFADRPSPSRDFGVPMDCVADLLMVWDFCSSFSRLLNLWPFSLEDFENAICHKDSNLILIVESHSALLRLLIKDESEYFMAIQEKRWKSKITLMNWTEYLCGFLEMDDIPELSSHIATIKRGHYGLLDVRAKLGIFRELVTQALATDAIREQLDEFIEQQQALASTRREEALEEARKRREEKEFTKADSDSKEVIQGHALENGRGNLHTVENGYDSRQNGYVPEERDEKVLSCQGSHVSEDSESKNVNNAVKKVVKKQKMDAKVIAENVKEPAGMEEHSKKLQLRKDNKKGIQEKTIFILQKVHFEREIEKRFIRTNPLGKDRNYSRYWFFRRDGRIFVESSDSKLWGYYSSKEEVITLHTGPNTILCILFIFGKLKRLGGDLYLLAGEMDCKLACLFRFSLPSHGEQEPVRNLLPPHKICEHGCLQLQSSFDRRMLLSHSYIDLALQKRSKDIAHKIALEEAVLRRSTRVRAPLRDSPAVAFLRYENKWKD